MKPIEFCCGTCSLWDREDAKDALGRVRRDRQVRCKWQMPTILLPKSYYTIGGTTWKLSRMSYNDGKGCLCWSERVEQS